MSYYTLGQRLLSQLLTKLTVSLQSFPKLLSQCAESGLPKTRDAMICGDNTSLFKGQDKSMHLEFSFLYYSHYVHKAKNLIRKLDISIIEETDRSIEIRHQQGFFI